MADSTDRFVIFWDIRDGQTRYRWRLRETTSKAGEWSETGYTDKSECIADIESMKKNQPDVPVVDLTIARS